MARYRCEYGLYIIRIDTGMILDERVCLGGGHQRLRTTWRQADFDIG